MSIYKRGNVYWYKFQFTGQSIRESTKQGNDKVARNIESAHRTRLAEGLVGIRERKPRMTLADFCTNRIEPWTEATLKTSSYGGWRWYRTGIRALKAYAPIANSKLDAINAESAADFAAHEQARELTAGSVNSELRVLRRILRLACEWGALESAPKIKMLRGEHHREHVVTPEEEAKYLAAAGDLLMAVASVLIDTGLRPDECYRLRWENITWSNGRNGTLMVTHGKTKAACRKLPLTARVRNILEWRWAAAGKPAEGWAWPSKTSTGHIDRGTLKHSHKQALRVSGVRRFVLYSLRHTFLTRLGESGCDVWTLARIAGHSSIAISARYVHPSENAVLDAMARLGGHNSGHSAKREIQVKEITAGAAYV